MMQYPIQLRFKTIALTNKIRVIGADQQEHAYVHQKLFKFKEEILVYADHTKTQQIYTIKADRVIDWSPEFKLTSPDGAAKASFKRRGTRSLFNATYDITLGDISGIILKEQNPWIKFLDALIGSLPFIGLFMGYFINPKYDILDQNGKSLAVLAKRPAFLEGFYDIEAHGIQELETARQEHLVLIVMAIATLERQRG